ncbi:LamG-like jellyroll fold domain-containing protein [Winogradskyella sp. MIT101101]|uniref:LamG-like jellyroll fold domain-containing protein n=1 Tax=Winogradskyella sp. MIT101101 TaxID=3098297 RepID=UPI00399C0138
MYKRLPIFILFLITQSLCAQTNAPSIQTGVSFQWADSQTSANQAATIKSVTVNNIVYENYGIPAGYTLTQLGSNGHNVNKIRRNGTYVETTSASSTWNNSALASFQDLNLNHYFEANGNGQNICDNYAAEQSTTAQRQTLTYGTGIFASSSGIIAITERNANNCYHVELFGIPVGGGAVQSLGETFVNETSTKWGYGGTGSSGNIGTAGAMNPPPSGSDYWLSDRVIENNGTIGIALFYLDDIAPNGSIITSAQLTASSNDHADGKLFILTLPDQDKDGFSDVDDLDDDNDGILDVDECSDLGKEPLLNSDFEDLDITNGLDGGPTDVVPNSGIWKGDASNVPNWLSSDATNNHLEIWHNTQTAGNDVGGMAYSGSQWAEVNATTNDGLYQDIQTSSGDVLQWSFAHRKRTGYAGSAQEDVVRLLIGDPSGTLTGQGDFSSAGDSSWTVHSGTYVVPNGQTTTRLTFTALQVAAGGSATTSGNFVDKVELYILPNCEDTDNDGLPDYFDIDSDDDGIPDNVEAQPSLGYVGPSGTGSGITDIDQNGIDDNFGLGFTILVDTDQDGIPDFRDLDSDSDGLPDIQENGLANAISGSDSDVDGLDNIFETTNINDALLDVNEDIEDPTDLSILPDTDGDLYIGGDLDYRDDLDVYHENATIDFDGYDDYLSGDSLIEGLGELTIMAWVKIDPSNSGNTYATIVGEGDAFKIFVQGGNGLRFSMRTTAGSQQGISGTNINYEEWHHLAATFSNSTGKLVFYVDGEEQGQQTNSGLVGRTLSSSGLWNGSFEIGRRSMDYTNKQYFAGDIDEVRIFDSALTEEQIRQMVYQEIEADNGLVKGKVTPKQIKDTKTLQTVPWSSLMGYWPMTDIKSSTTTDHSGNGRTLKLMNIRTVQEQTAPIPYETGGNGDWTNEGTWLHGDVWDIEDVPSNKDWGIVHIKHNVTSSASHTNLALLIDSDRTLTINGDNKVENNWYLELNGTLDLMDDSQLVQTVTSDLVTSSSGRVKRRQEGTNNKYWYNYWASPVGGQGATSLTDNNTTNNNPNNSGHSLNMLKKADASSFQFTDAYDETGKISRFWLYKYQNGVTYYDYEGFDENTALQPGVGYTQKGTGISGSEQQYLFEGKPNNGTIVVPVTDTGGSGSVPAVSKTDYLLGNPYPSALDIHEFIDDNMGVIDGTIQLWQQWSGSSHYLDEYNGGYAQVNKLGSVRAYQFVGIEGETNGSQDGTKTPSRYLPVGQGFMTEIENSGNIVFKNSQRVFIKESDANGSYNNGSVFFRGTSNSQNVTEQQNSDPEEDPMQKIRLEFNSVDGPATRRELLLGFSEDTSDDYDYGYDSKNVEEYSDDLNLALEDELMTMQAYGPITEDKAVPLVLKTSGSYNYTIKVSEMENIPEAQELYIKDNLTGEYFDLRNEEQPFEFSSEEGEFNDRLEIVFQQQQSETLSQIEENIEDINLYYAMGRKKIVVLNPTNEDLKSMEIINMLGQSVARIGTFEGSYNEYGLPQLSAGTYIVNLTTATGASMTRKFIVK